MNIPNATGVPNAAQAGPSRPSAVATDAPQEQRHNTPAHRWPLKPTSLARACNPAYQLRRALANKKNADGETRLGRAVRYSELSAVKIQLDVGADPNLRLHDGTPMLHRAVLNGDVDIVQALASARDIDPNVTDRNGKTPLHLAVERHQPDMALALLGAEGVDVNQPDERHDSPLHLAARKKDIQMALLLLSRPDTDPNGASTLYFRSDRLRDHFRLQAGLGPEAIDTAQFHIDELRRWSGFVPRLGAPNRALTMRTHYLLANLLIDNPDLALATGEECVKDAAFHAALALEQSLQIYGNQHDNTRHFAATVLNAAPDAPTFNIGGIVVPRSDIEDIADERGQHALAANLNMIAGGQWRANVHLAGFLMRGSEILARLRAHTGTPATLQQVTHEVRALIDLRHTGSEARLMHDGLDQTLAQTRPVDEGGLHTSAPETLQLLHGYITNRPAPLQANLQAALLQRLRDIGSDDGVCNTGCVQRLLDTPGGIDPDLMAREPDDAAILAEIRNIAGQVNNTFEENYVTDYATGYVGKLVPALRTLARPQNQFDTDITSLKQDILRATVIDDLVRQRGWNRARVEPQLASVVESMKHV